MYWDNGKFINNKSNIKSTNKKNTDVRDALLNMASGKNTQSKKLVFDPKSKTFVTKSNGIISDSALVIQPDDATMYGGKNDSFR